MCLIFVAHRVRADLPFLAIANRDEFHARPTAPAARWDGDPGVLAGRDLQAGGTWMGVAEGGRFAALTNYRDGGRPVPGAAPGAAPRPSRGELTAAFLRGRQRATDYAAEVAARGGRYNGFTLLLHDGETLAVCSNRDDAPRALAPGVYGLSNAGLDSEWPKVARGKQALRRLLGAPSAPAAAPLFQVLADRQPALDAALPDTGVGVERERMLSPMFILGNEYGTRCSTVVMDCAASVQLTERRFDPAGASVGESSGSVGSARVNAPQ